MRITDPCPKRIDVAMAISLDILRVPGIIIGFVLGDCEFSCPLIVTVAVTEVAGEGIFFIGGEFSDQVDKFFVGSIMDEESVRLLCAVIKQERRFISGRLKRGCMPAQSIISP